MKRLADDLARRVEALGTDIEQWRAPHRFNVDEFIDQKRAFRDRARALAVELRDTFGGAVPNIRESSEPTLVRYK